VVYNEYGAYVFICVQCFQDSTTGLHQSCSQGVW